MSGFQALVLAGSRGVVDPVAAYAGVSHKGLAKVGERTMLERVLAALAEAGAENIAVCTGDAALAAAARAAVCSAEVQVIPAQPSPSLSVRTALEQLGAPLLVTTVDHALLKPEWVRAFIADTPADADIAILLGEEAVVQTAAPQTKRTYLPFRDGRFSGCNLFYLASPRASAGLDLWRRVEEHRKQPWRIAMLLGPGVLAGFLLRRFTLKAAVARLGAKAGIKAAAVTTPFGLAAVDVDKPSDLDLARSLADAL